MRNVKRIGKPVSLQRNAAKWTAELLAAIGKSRKRAKKVPKKFYDRYQCDDVRDALNSMYKGLCCYCEARIATVSYEHIEHRRPKQKYPKHAFRWDNMHLACSRCNSHKGIKFSKEHPILDAVLDIPISDHLSYKIDEFGVWRLPLSRRGETTWRDTDLDRDALLTARREIWDSAVYAITEINKDVSAVGVDARIKHLMAMCHGPYGSLVEYAMDNLLRHKCSRNANVAQRN
jgi:hypothetical protein